MYGIVKRYFLNSMHFFEYIKKPLSLAFKGFQGFKPLNCMICYELYFYCISASLFHQLPGIFFRFGTILKQKARCKMENLFTELIAAVWNLFLYLPHCAHFLSVCFLRGFFTLQYSGWSHAWAFAGQLQQHMLYSSCLLLPLSEVSSSWLQALCPLVVLWIRSKSFPPIFRRRCSPSPLSAQNTSPTVSLPRQTRRILCSAGYPGRFPCSPSLRQLLPFPAPRSICFLV